MRKGTPKPFGVPGKPYSLVKQPPASRAASGARPSARSIHRTPQRVLQWERWAPGNYFCPKAAPSQGHGRHMPCTPARRGGRGRAVAGARPGAGGWTALGARAAGKPGRGAVRGAKAGHHHMIPRPHARPRSKPCATAKAHPAQGQGRAHGPTGMVQGWAGANFPLASHPQKPYLCVRAVRPKESHHGMRQNPRLLCNRFCVEQTT
jgi:hypothetical protein